MGDKRSLEYDWGQGVSEKFIYYRGETLWVIEGVLLDPLVLGGRNGKLRIKGERGNVQDDFCRVSGKVKINVWKKVSWGKTDSTGTGE